MRQLGHLLGWFSTLKDPPNVLFSTPLSHMYLNVFTQALANSTRGKREDCSASPAMANGLTAPETAVSMRIHNNQAP